MEVHSAFVLNGMMLLMFYAVWIFWNERFILNNDGEKLLVDHARWSILDLFLWFSSLIVCGINDAYIS
tara:strand:- start:93 stop:296 length:204 start_codon:yes stop_codon:yes gene_type:complete